MIFYGNNIISKESMSIYTNRKYLYIENLYDAYKMYVKEIANISCHYSEENILNSY